MPKDPAKPPHPTFRVVSWNVNGLRAAARKGFFTWLAAEPADVVALQETRALPEQLDETFTPEGWSRYLAPAERKGYSGVGAYSRRPADAVDVTLSRPEFDIEGRHHELRFGALTVVNCYFPNGSGRDRDLSRIPFKLDFYDHLRVRLAPRIAAGERVLVVGDFNTAHRAADLARPKQNEQTSGFRPEERAALDRWFDDGWVDTFRHMNPDTRDRYTWWSQRFGVRERNVGWRIDYVLASPAAMPFMRGAEIHDDVPGSDHCPISVDLDRPAVAQ